MPALDSLADLLADLFNQDELVDAINRLPDGGSISRTLPAKGAPITVVAAEAEAALRRRGHIDHDFFVLLTNLRPRRTADIHRVRATLMVEHVDLLQAEVESEKGHLGSTGAANLAQAAQQPGSMVFNAPVIIQGGHVGTGPHHAASAGSAGGVSRRKGLSQPPSSQAAPIVSAQKPLSALERLAEDARRRERQALEAAQAKQRRDEMVLAGAAQATAEILGEIKAFVEKAMEVLPDGRQQLHIEAGTRDIAVYYLSGVVAVQYHQFYTNVPDGKLRVLYSTRKGDWFRNDWVRESDDAYPLEFTSESGLHWSVNGRKMQAKDLAEKLVVRLIELGDRRHRQD